MPQLIAFAVAGTIAYAGYKWLARQKARAAQKVRTQAQQANQPRDLGELYWDETAGVYRPRRQPGSFTN